MAKKTEQEVRWRDYTPTKEDVIRAYLKGHPERTRAEIDRFFNQIEGRV